MLMLLLSKCYSFAREVGRELPASTSHSGNSFCYLSVGQQWGRGRGLEIEGCCC